VDFISNVSYFWTQLSGLLFSLGSEFSFASLATALAIATAYYAYKRIAHGRRVRPRTILRALFPKHVVASPSSYTDLGYLYFNLFVLSLVIGWGVLTFQTVTNGIVGGLVRMFGEPGPAPLPDVASRAVVTVVLFLAYELGYWFNHWLSHRVPVLWEFHKVHHSAEVLTPLTNFRVHPVYTWVFTNILALATAIASGFTHYFLGETTKIYVLSDHNVILVFFIYAYVHLQHTNIWISFTGWLGRIFVSPAHHQIHHSNDPKHFNRNFGSCLALWDWMFGTLYVPAREREKISFGVEPDQYPAHTITGELIAPFIRAYNQIRARLPQSSPRPKKQTT
jgi:sterol desaturase/sphingolipid hydroxylase (fatty acid hydroxylase superfamily)